MISITLPTKHYEALKSGASVCVTFHFHVMDRHVGKPIEVKSGHFQKDGIVVTVEKHIVTDMTTSYIFRPKVELQPTHARDGVIQGGTT